MQQFYTKKRNGGQNAKTEETRERFLHAFEKTFGNISASCQYAQINRTTYYRWMKSKSRLNQKFQRKIKLLQPVEALLDLAETVLNDQLQAGSLRAAEFVLKTRGRSRGYVTKDSEKKPSETVLSKVATDFQAWLDDYQPVSHEAKVLWLKRFAKGRGVDAKELARRVGIKLPDDFES